MTVRPPTHPLPAPVPPLPQTGIGIVAPYDFALDRELWRWVPDDVTLHVTRTPYAPLAARATNCPSRSWSPTTASTA